MTAPLSMRRVQPRMNEHEEVIPMSLDDRVKRAQISFAELSRRSQIHSWKLYGGYSLNESERARVDAVLAEAERRHNRWRDPAYV